VPSPAQAQCGSERSAWKASLNPPALLPPASLLWNCHRSRGTKYSPVKFVQIKGERLHATTTTVLGAASAIPVVLRCTDVFVFASQFPTFTRIAFNHHHHPLSRVSRDSPPLSPPPHSSPFSSTILLFR
jgi:hypothetical protein